jgi:hypothetical protein
MFSGGGLKMGQVIGQSDRNAGEPQTEPLRIPRLIGTVLNTLFDTGTLRLNQSVPTAVSSRLTGHEALPGLG